MFQGVKKVLRIKKREESLCLPPYLQMAHMCETHWGAVPYSKAPEPSPRGELEPRQLPIYAPTNLFAFYNAQHVSAE